MEVRAIRPGAFQFYREIPPEYLKPRKRTVAETVEDYVKDPDLQESRENIREVQRGGKFHGDLIAASHFILSKTYDLYDTPGHARVSTVVEGELEGLKPDLLDINNGVVVECGLILGEESKNAFILKSLRYCYRLNNPSEWTFIHIPKSFFEYGDNSSSQLSPYTIAELNLSAGIDRYKREFKEEYERQREKERRDMFEKIRKSDEDFLGGDSEDDDQ